MKEPIADQEKLTSILQTNKLAILLEIVVVFLPFILGLILSDRLGNDRISLGGNLFILGGSITYLGLTISLVLLWVFSRIRSASWHYFGLFQGMRREIGNKRNP